ncbi:MAG: plasmid mobilization relaxosome protein MobC [Bdellovibrionales bacterium]|nr:plasmid mobilization relaxosome protein MobC [Massilia sp.]
MAALRQLARQLADIGRNINQIAKSLHCSLDNAHMAMALDFDALKMLIEVETVMVKELVRANVQFWRGEP